MDIQRALKSPRVNKNCPSGSQPTTGTRADYRSFLVCCEEYGAKYRHMCHMNYQV